MSEVQETGQSRRIERIEKPQASSSKTRKVYVLGVAFVAVLLLGTSLGMMLSATTPSIPTVIEPGSMTSEFSYVIFQDGASTYLRSGSTGGITYSSTSSYSAIQYGINAVANASGGSIYLKLGTYTIVGALNITKSNITVSADPGTTILSSSLPVLSIWGPTPYGDDFDPFHNRLYNVHISNLQMFYTGTANITGAFVKIHRANLGAMVVPGGLTFENMVIEGPAQPLIPTNRDYIGLQAEDYCGARFTDVSVAWFGTGIKLGATWDVDYGTWFANDGNQYVRVHVGACDQGVWYSQGTSWMERWTSLKIFACAVFGINGSVPVLYLDSPHFEGFTAYNRSGIPQVALNISNGEGILTVISGEFQGIKDYGIKLSGTTATIMNCFFSVGETAIWLYYSNVHLIGNRYENWGASPPNHKVERFGSIVTAENDDYKLFAAGLIETNGANYFQVLHGLDVTPYHITITTNVTSTVTGGWSYGPDPDYLTVYFANAGYYFVAWTAAA